MLLDEILDAKRQELEEAKTRLPLAQLQEHMKGRLAQRSFRRALHSARRLPALIAELKRKSPSKGMLRERFDPVSLAQQLEAAGAAALSVLTDAPFFGGSLDFLRDVHEFTEIPTLRKDFVLDSYQVYEAAWYQADAVLLIVQILNDEELSRCLQTADLLGMDALVEVHTEDDLKRAVGAGASVIGINHRNLRTFEMEPDISNQLVPKIPAGKLIVAESGVQTPADIQRLRALGVQAVLIGEALMTANDPAAKIRELFG